MIQVENGNSGSTSGSEGWVPPVTLTSSTPKSILKKSVKDGGSVSDQGEEEPPLRNYYVLMRSRHHRLLTLGINMNLKECSIRI